jgi:hypothetical protein
VLHISQVLTTPTLAQYERKYVAAFSPLVKMLVYVKLTASRMLVLYFGNTTAGPKRDMSVLLLAATMRMMTAITLPLAAALASSTSTISTSTSTSNMSPASRECLERAITEFERRFPGNTPNARLPLNPAPVVAISERLLVVILLDVCTSKGLHLTEQQRPGAQAALKERYIVCHVAKM